MTGQSEQGQPVDAGSIDAVRADVAAFLKEVLKKRTGKDSAGWDEATLLTDTGIDSFDAIECVFEVEEHYSIELDYNANDPQAKISTIGDVVDMAARAIVERRAA